MKYRRNLFIVYRVVEGKKIIFTTDSDISFELDEVGVFIWKHLDGTKDNEHIAELIARKYQCAKNEVLVDVNNFVNELHEYKLVDLLEV